MAPIHPLPDAAPTTAELAPKLLFAALAEPDPKLPFAALYAQSYGQTRREQWQRAWDACIEQWLDSGNRRSTHTRRAYRHNVTTFQEYLANSHGINHLWQVSPPQVTGWMAEMSQFHLSEATINQRLATLNSLYKYAASTTTIIGGHERSLFIDAHGNRCLSPFAASSVQRPKVIPYGSAVACPAEAYSWMIYDLQQRTPTVSNLRNLALLLMFGLNGWLVSEVLSMQWQYIQKGEYQYGYEWTGKGSDGERITRPLPAPNYSAIINYLTVAGRFHPDSPSHPAQIQDDEYIWQPVTNVMRNNFANEPRNLSRNRPISRSSATGIFQRSLSRYYRQRYRQMGHADEDATALAQVEAKKYTLHSLRHMVAQQLYSASNNDLKSVQELMNHQSLVTTQLCLENMQTPVDTHSHLLLQQLALNFPSEGS